MERVYRYVLAGAGEETFICSRCGNSRTVLKKCEFCGFGETFIMRHKGEKSEEPVIRLVPTMWRKEEITSEERLKFESTKHGGEFIQDIEISKYPARIRLSNLKKIRQCKIQLAKALFGKLLKAKYPIEKCKKELTDACNNGIFDEIVRRYFSKEMDEFVKEGLSESEAYSKVLGSLSETLPKKSIPPSKKKLYVQHLIYVRELNEKLTAAISGRRKELSKLSGDGFYHAIVGVYFVDEMRTLTSTREKTDIQARDEILSNLTERMIEKLGPKYGPFYQKYADKIQSLADELTPPQLRAACNRTPPFEGFDREQFSHTDVSFMKETKEEIQAGDVLLAVDAMPSLVRQISDSPDEWYYSEKGEKLFRIIHPINQVHEFKTWGFDSANVESDTRYRSVIRAYMEDILHITEDIDNESYVDALGDVFEIDKWNISSRGKENIVENMAIFANISDSYNDDDGYDDDSSEISFQSNTVISNKLPSLPDEIQKKVDKAVQEYRDNITKIDQAEGMLGIDENLTPRQKRLIKKHEEQQKALAAMRDAYTPKRQIEPSEEEEDRKEEKKSAKKEPLSIEEKIQLQKQLLKEFELEKLERRIDELAADELTLRFDSPYHCFGYTPPGRRYDNIKQFPESLLTNDKEERIKLFFSMAADILDCNTKREVFTVRGRKRETKGTLSYEYDVYKRFVAADVETNSRWTEEKRQEAMHKYITKQREEGVDEQKIKNKVWFLFQRSKKQGAKKDCIWLKDKTNAMRSLVFNGEQRPNVYKFQELAKYRIWRNSQDSAEAARWAKENPLSITTKDMFVRMRPLVKSMLTSKIEANRRLANNLCWIRNQLMPVMSATLKGYNISVHRNMTRDEADSFLGLHETIEDAISIQELNNILIIMRKRTFLTLTDIPAELPIELNIPICKINNKLCYNTQRCEHQKKAFRTTLNEVKHTQRFQLLASEEIGKTKYFKLKDEVNEFYHERKIFGAGPSHIDKITPLEEMYLMFMIVTKKNFFIERLQAYSKLDSLVKEEIQTELPEIYATCQRPVENTEYILNSSGKLIPNKTTSYCLTTPCQRPIFARLPGGKGHLFIRCESCGRRIWLIGKDERLNDVKTLEELNERWKECESETEEISGTETETSRDN